MVAGPRPACHPSRRPSVSPAKSLRSGDLAAYNGLVPFLPNPGVAMAPSPDEPPRGNADLTTSALATIDQGSSSETAADVPLPADVGRYHPLRRHATGGL